MPQFFRSEKMSLCTMLLHTESAFDCLVELGHLGLVQFISYPDGEHEANLKFTNEVKRCSEMQRILKHLQSQIDDSGLETIYYPDVDNEEIPQGSDIKHIELMLRQIETELSDVERHREVLEDRYRMLQEKQHVLTKTEEFFTGVRNTETVMAWSDSIIMQLIRDETKHNETDAHTQQRLGFFAGTILVDRYRAFETTLWRVCHSNFFMKWTEIPSVGPDPRRPNVKLRKYAFVVLFVGDVMRQKIAKVCQAFSVVLHEYPEAFEDRVAKRKLIASDMADLKTVLDQTHDHRRRILLAATLDLFIWRTKITKILKVYVVLNKLGTVQQVMNQKYLQAECWIPTRDIPKVRVALMRGARRASKGGIPFPPILTEIKYRRHEREPPTYFPLNKFTRGFQNLIDAYGIANYQELNPAPYTIITFPFLFAVMFGDIGHGFIMALFALWMCITEKELERKRQLEKSPNEIFSLLFGGRYIILLMGIFSIYTGLIYNDIFSKSLNLFGSHWRVNYTEADVLHNKHLQLDPARSEFYLGYPYIFGMDPVWDASGENAIITFNSYKMKLAIILGVAQMLFGLGLSAWNFVYSNSAVDLYLVFVPQTVFLCCLFLYLAFMIFYKWCTFGGHYASPYNSACAPSILISFIDMILMKQSEETPPGCVDEMYSSQGLLQIALVFFAFVSVPVLLVGKPLHFMNQRNKIKAIRDAEKQRKMKARTLSSVRKSLVYNVEYMKEESSMHVFAKGDHDVDMSELWIHQGIHCIESVLGSVSHTASYLRLWALSLAHDQLSTVLWNMVLALGLKSNGGYWNSLMLYSVFWFWAVLTVAILVVMEGLSAFLHTLRLHWVEFQSKFYSGSGEIFFPFRFEPSRPFD